MTSVTQAITTALIQFVWQGALVGTMLWLVLALLRRKSATMRYATSCGAMAIMVLLPAVTAYRAYSRPAELPAVPATSSPSATTVVPGADARPILPGWVEMLRAWALPIWLLGVMGCSVRLIWSGRQIASLRRTAGAAGEVISTTVQQLAERLRSSRSVQVLISQVVDGPSVIGWIRPIILVPASSLTGLSPEQLEAVLAHEVAHIRRYDDLVNMLQALVETLLFYHPAVWWTSACIRRERELCCDDLAVCVTGNGLGYARALARLERIRLTSTAMALGAVGHSLSYRIRRIVGDAGPDSSQTNMSGVVALSIGLGLAAIAISAGPMHSQTEQPAGWSAHVMETPEGRGGFVFAQAEGGKVFFSMDAAGVTVDTGAANVMHRTGVEYPQAARKNGIDGTVTLEVTLDSNGSVTDARVLAGPVELRRICLQSVLQWHFASDTANATRQVAIRFDSKVAAEPQPWIDSGVIVAKQKAEDKVRLSGGKIATVTIPGGRPVTVRINPAPEASKLAQSTPSVEILRDRIGELEREEEQLARTFSTENPERVEVENEIRQAREQLEREVSGQTKILARRKVDEVALQAQLLEMQKQAGVNYVTRDDTDQAVAVKKQLEQVQRTLRETGGRAVIAGRTLTRIAFEGVPDLSQSAVRPRLPVKLGDTLTDESIKSVIAAVRAYDEHFFVTFNLLGDNEAVLSISLRQ
jgi:TonB family protein